VNINKIKIKSVNEGNNSLYWRETTHYIGGKQLIILEGNNSLYWRETTHYIA
jgi:hypothetical protein